MKLIKTLPFVVLLWLVSTPSLAQYMERPEVIHFHGDWIAVDQGYDSVLLELRAERKFPVKTAQWDTGVITDVLLMDIKCYTAGKLIYRVENLEQKHDNQFFIAIMADPEAYNSTEFHFRYTDDNMSQGKGTLHFSNGIMQMRIEEKDLIDKKPSEDEGRDNRATSIESLSIPGKLNFVKKSKMILL